MKKWTAIFSLFGFLVSVAAAYSFYVWVSQGFSGLAEDQIYMESDNRPPTSGILSQSQDVLLSLKMKNFTAEALREKAFVATNPSEFYDQLDGESRRDLVQRSIEQSHSLIACFADGSLCGQVPDSDGFFDVNLTPKHHELAWHLEIIETAVSEKQEWLDDVKLNDLMSALSISHSTIPLTAFRLILAKSPSQEQLLQALDIIQEGFGPTQVQLLRMVAFQDNQDTVVRKSLLGSVVSALTSNKAELVAKESLANQLHTLGLSDREMQVIAKEACPRVRGYKDLGRALNWQFRRYDIGSCGGGS